MMEKMPDIYNPEKELDPELKKMKQFFIQHLPLTVEKEIQLDKSEIKDSFQLYQNFINKDVSFKHFLEINNMDSNNSKETLLQDELLEELWLKYLINKLPKALVQRQLEIQEVDNQDDLSYKKLEKLHKRRMDSGHKMILGIQTSPIKITGEITTSRLPTTLISDGSVTDISSGHSYYSLTPDSLYKMEGYLTFVEGDTYEAKQEKEKRGAVHGKGKWIATTRKLPTLSESFKLNNEIIEKLNLSRSV